MNMKQLKFRGLAVESIPGLSNWVHGHDIRIDHNKKTAHIGGSEVLYDTVGQSTGETDKNGRDIYDDDLLEVHDGATEDYPHFLAQVHRHGASFNLTQPVCHNTIIAQPMPHYIRNTGIIIGNIHEHKDMIPEWEAKIEKENAGRQYRSC